MLIRRADLERIASGEVTLAFRRWIWPTVKAGTRLKTASGVVEIVSVAVVEDGDLNDAEATAAGFASREALFQDLRQGEGRALHRIALRFAGADPRDALRLDDALGAAEVADIAGALARLDRAARGGAWTGATLDIIRRRPATRAAALAAELGRPTADFKRDVRKLKNLGLTESLDMGYRLSLRGEAAIRRLAHEA
ncbi:hypothetical protein GCM10008171_09980 [Methylopila jiangsuensis]|uniref:ASCH domain-containing protein n=1 Tax=Methylopila jiangsuensis TaxID=586230 RepID=A0A9W6N2A9_9HYPH|nr:hypothetical protein [Methylopila jiangsuensis]MDR6285987.1 hypothetical protein [Methylopila jiangsuensis]GLK75744.1 hypothetical protein GCM10008171_09980 [Methylopila jiangsuensis]